MDPVIAATLIGVLGTALIGVLAGAFHLLRSDLKDIRAENRADHRETNKRIDRLEGRFERLEGRFEQLEGRFEQVEGKLDGLIWAMAQAGFPAQPQPPQPPTEPPG